jgi:predicted RNA binding protein YcfA (HicA-like mRNA interferase family)
MVKSRDFRKLLKQNGIIWDVSGTGRNDHDKLRNPKNDRTSTFPRHSVIDNHTAEDILKQLGLGYLKSQIKR